MLLLQKSNSEMTEAAKLQSQERFWQARMKSLEQSHQQELRSLMGKLGELKSATENAKRIIEKPDREEKALRDSPFPPKI